MYRTPPRPSPDGPPAGVFVPPSARLGAVTKKINEIKELMNGRCEDKELLQTYYKEYEQKVETLITICNDQELNEENKVTRQEWVKDKDSAFISFQVQFEKYLNGLTHSNLPNPSLKSRSSKSSTSSARVRLAEARARLEAEKLYNQKLAALEAEKREHRRKVEEQEQAYQKKCRDAEIARKELECHLLQRGLDNLDGIAGSSRLDDGNVDHSNAANFNLNHSDETDANVVPANRGNAILRNVRHNDRQSGSQAPHTRGRFDAMYAGENELTNVLRRQNEISLAMVRHQEKAELPKRELKVFDGMDITDFRPFMHNFIRTVEDKCDNSADRFYYLLQFTTGVAHDLVKSCQIGSSEVSYNTAIKLLEDEYGNEHKSALAYLDKLEKWPDIKSEDGESLKKLAIFLRTCLNNLGDMGIVNQLNSPKEIMAVIHKLPFELRKRWRDKTLKISQRYCSVTFTELVDFVQEAADLLSQPIFGCITSDVSGKDKPKRKILATKSEEISEPLQPADRRLATCTYCKKSNHELPRCFFFGKLDHDKKTEFLRKFGLCFSCLQDGHLAKGCNQRLKCERCEKKHPTILHNDKFRQSSGKTISDNGSPKTHFRATNKVDNYQTGAGSTGKVLCAVLPVKIKVEGRANSVLTYASLDTCSSACFMNDNLLKTLGVKTNKSNMHICTMENVNASVATRVVHNLQIYDLNDNLKDTIPVVFAQQNWPFNADDAPKPEHIEDHLSEVPFNFIDTSIGMVIGMDRPELVKPLQIVDGPPHMAYASLHSLGWALNGPVKEKGKVMINRIKVENPAEIDNMINVFAKDYIDTNEVNKQMSSDDKEWYAIMQKSLHKDIDKYEIDLPLKESLSLPSNKGQIYAIFQSLQRKLLADTKLFLEYSAFMKMMHEKGFIEKVPLNEIDKRSWYLMHHSVYHKQKKTIRVVFNCSLKYNGISLNDLLYQGPDLSNNLLGVIMRFRQEPIAFTGDLEKMFYQVHVSPKHRDYLRFFWLDNFDAKISKPCEYRLTVHVFGAKSSPSVANYALQQTVIDNPEYSEAAKTAVNRRFYIDDLLCSVKTEQEADQLLAETKSLVATAGFNLTKIISNSRQICDKYSNGEQKELGPSESSLVLGLKWETITDTLKFNVKTNMKDCSTRRDLLSTVHGLYDPLGMAGPVIIPAKRLFQASCTAKLTWDDELPTDIQLPLSSWLKELPKLSAFSFDRCCRPVACTSTELHYFCDGSETAYGAVVYARFNLENGNIHCSPLIAKSRLTPVGNSTYKTIPRIELNGAKLSILLKQIIHSELEYKIDREFFWTDSSTVLHYLNSDSGRFSRFVSNRVGFILSNSNKTDWQYVPSSLNPADYISRGVSVSKFLTLTDWINGPDFLWQPQTEWPDQTKLNIAPTENLELSNSTCLTSIVDNSNFTKQLIESCSNWYQLKCRVAWFNRFKGYLQRKTVTDELSVVELELAEKAIIKYVQQQNFGTTIYLINKGKALPKKCSLRRLDPYLDEEGFLRVGGRLQRSDINFEAKHPLLLPNNCFITTLLIRNCHVKLGHLGRETLAASLRSKYWIIGLNNAIRKVMHNCTICRRLNAQPTYPKMAALPDDRVVGDDPPFTSTGLDFFGPFEVVNGRKREKRYGVVFTCLTSRAIHLEMAHSLSTDSFLNALRRFMCRRGQVKLIRSDNGTNIRSGEKELNAAIREWNHIKIESWMRQHCIDWKFQPPSASHFGGVFEREIRTIRKVLNALLKEQPLRLNDEHLNTLLCEVENILNNRPLTEQTSTINDPTPLTPNHLLLNSGVTFPPGVFTKSSNYATRRWKQIQYLADLFWTRWRKSYLPLLQIKQRWHTDSYNYKVGDLVLLTDVLLPRSQWCLGKIVEVYPDNKATVRVVKVKISKTRDSGMGTSELVRPVTKLILIKSCESLLHKEV